MAVFAGVVGIACGLAMMSGTRRRSPEVGLAAAVACERDGTLIAVRGDVHTDMGAYMRTNGAVGARNVSQFMAGPYRVPYVKIDSSLIEPMPAS